MEGYRSSRLKGPSLNDHQARWYCKGLEALTCLEIQQTATPERLKPETVTYNPMSAERVADQEFD